MILFLFITIQIISETTGGKISESLLDLCTDNGTRLTLMLDLPEVIPVYEGKQGVDATEDIIESLKRLTSAAQLPIIQTVRKTLPEIKDDQVRQYWIANRIGLTDVSCSVIQKIACIPYTFIIRAELILHIMGTDGRGVQPRNIEKAWGVERVNAAKVWPFTKGAGVVVATIDGGVRATHIAVKDNFRKDFRWLDGITNSSTEEPKDELWGTFVIGVICGNSDVNIGVAPEATWITCKACTQNRLCKEIDLLTCAQWVMCPYEITNGITKQNCSKRPKVLHNSWGGSERQDAFIPVLRNWHRAAIIPVFAVANSGPKCFSVGSPADQPNVISVGGIYRNGGALSDSGRGPSKWNHKIKPDVMAPASSITSTSKLNDIGYQTDGSGTLVASAHVTGTIALLLAKNSSLGFNQILSILQTSAVKPTDAVTAGLTRTDTCSCNLASNAEVCAAEPINWPNNLFGHGVLDTEAAFALVQK